jgi:hypothetical protein
MSNNPGQQQPWFLGAPATKLLSFATVLSYVVIHAKNAHSLYSMDSNKILEGEWWRLIVGNVTFATTGELVMGTLVLAHFSRRFVRELGSRKFCMWLIESYMLAIPLLWTIAATVLHSLNYSGPYPALGALLYLYYKYTPRLHPRFFGIFGFHVSEKVIPYVFAVQIVLYRGIHSVIPVACGVVGGWLSILYTMDVPDGVANFLAKCAQKVVEEPPPLLAPALAAARRQQVRQRAPVAPPVRAAPPPVEPTQANIDQLTAMGFDRDTVVRALQQSNNNVERALDRLLIGAG